MIAGAIECSLLASVNAEKGEVAATRKGIQVSAGVGHAVDLVKGIRKEDDAHGLNPFWYESG